MKIVRRVNLLSFLFICLYIFSGCSQETNNSEQSQDANSKTSQFSIPSAISSAVLPSGATLIASVYIDGSATPAASQSFTLPVSGNVAIPLSNLSVGNHSFTIVFSYTNDPPPTSYTGTFELARATKNGISIAKGSNPDLVFVDTDYDTTADSDNDGVSNLDELDASKPPRSDPGDKTCILDKSILQNDSMQGCTLG